MEFRYPVAILDAVYNAQIRDAKKGRTMTEQDGQDFQDLLADANTAADTYTDEAGNEIEIVAAADLTRTYDDNGHRPTQEQAFRRLLGGA